MRVLFDHVFYMLATIWSISRKRVVTQLVVEVFQSIETFVSTVLLFRVLVMLLQSMASYMVFLQVILVIMAMGLIRAGINAWYYFGVAEELDITVQNGILEKVYAKAGLVELDRYEDPGFYDELSRTIKSVSQHTTQIMNNVCQFASMVVLY